MDPAAIVINILGILFYSEYLMGPTSVITDILGEVNAFLVFVIV